MTNHTNDTREYKITVANNGQFSQQVVSYNDDIPVIKSYDTLHVFLNWLDEGYLGNEFIGWTIVRLDDGRVSRMKYGNIETFDILGWAWNRRRIINDTIRTHVTEIL